MPAERGRFAAATYAGVLGKMIGVYLGRPVEGWAYEAIRERFGEVDGYVHEALGLPLVVADDDLSGSFGFFRALEDSGYAGGVTAADFGDTWLNTIIEDKTILWWGGFGRSTEHTAYLRLKAGYRAPHSGSSALNGAMLSTQIGAQIFTDPLALMSPGDPEQAGALIRTAASVSHDGVALDCAAYLGALQALAFEHRALAELLDAAEPFACGDQLRRLLDDVRAICSRERDWRQVRAWLDPRYGYGVFPGPCPILTNHAMVLVSLLLGGDDFRRAVTIAASAGYDTDCNAGSVGCLNGVRLGLAAIPAELREPVGDRLLVVTAEGGRCVSDAVQETRRILQAGAAFRGVPGAADVSGSRGSLGSPDVAGSPGRCRLRVCKAAALRIRTARRPARLCALPARPGRHRAGARGRQRRPGRCAVLPRRYRCRPGAGLHAGVPGLRRGGGQLLHPCQPHAVRHPGGHRPPGGAATGHRRRHGPGGRDLRAVLRRRRPRAGTAIVGADASARCQHAALAGAGERRHAVVPHRSRAGGAARRPVAAGRQPAPAERGLGRRPARLSGSAAC